MNFSILIPTRTRIPLLANLLSSIFQTTKEQSLVEVLIVYDLDDIGTINVIQQFEEQYKYIHVKFYGKERSIAINKDYYNWLAVNHAKGDYVLAVNDDCLFLKSGWDVLGVAKLKEYLQDKPDGVVYGLTEDNEYEPTRAKTQFFSCFPLVSLKAVQVLGGIFDDEFHRDGADWAIFPVYFHFQRVIDLRDCIVIQHISVRSKRRQWDALDDYSLKLSKVLKYPGTQDFVQRNINKLKPYIDSFKPPEEPKQT